MKQEVLEVIRNEEPIHQGDLFAKYPEYPERKQWRHTIMDLEYEGKISLGWDRCFRIGRKMK